MRFLTVLGSCLLVLTLASCAGAPWEPPTPIPTATTTPVPTATLVPPTQIPTQTPIPNLSNVEIADMLRPSTVYIEGKFAETALDPEGFGHGTGIVYNTEKGYILTAAHVVEGAASIKVYTAGVPRPRSAKVIGRAMCEDLAVLKVDSTDGLVAAKLGDSNAVKVGIDAVALGYPVSLGNELDLAVNPGTISKKGVQQPPYRDLLQTTAVIAPGNSGGPLVNRQGEVIGINVLSFSPEQRAATSYYAIAISVAKGLLKELEEGKNREYIGLNLYFYGNDFEEHFGTKEGVVVLGVENGSPGSQAGLQPADLLLKLGGVTVNSIADVCDVLSSHSDGDLLRTTVLRVDPTTNARQTCEGDITMGKGGGGNTGQMHCTPLQGGNPPPGGGQGSSQNPTPNPGPPADCRGYSDFSLLVCNDFNDNKPGPWPVGNNDQLTDVVVDGKFITHVHTKRTLFTNIPEGTVAESDLADGAIEAVLRIEGDGVAGVMGRFSESDGVLYFYDCWINNAQQFGCFKWLGERHVPIVKTVKREEIRPGEENTIQLFIVGKTLVFSINGVDVAQIDDESLTSGGWGMFASGGESNDFKVYYDQIRIFEAR